MKIKLKSSIFSLTSRDVNNSENEINFRIAKYGLHIVFTKKNGGILSDYDI